jgi:hypothetical protein
MLILEVHVTPEKGSSCALLVDEEGEVIGMLHGGFRGAHSYFVDERHLRMWVLPTYDLDYLYQTYITIYNSFLSIHSHHYLK